MRWVLRSKIHKAQVTLADIEYEGSIGIDKHLIEKSGLLPGEKVLVVSNDSGDRLETYVIELSRNSGCIEMNGAAAHRIQKNEEIIIMGFELSENSINPTKIRVDNNNSFMKYI